MLDYRKIIGTRKFRIKVLSLLNWMPDKIIVGIQYFLQTGRKLHLKNPETFGEYLQAYKLKYRNPLMHQCVDKAEVRKYVETKGLSEILIPQIGIFNSEDDINYKELPRKFVVKTSDGGGNNEILLCKDKKKLDEKDFRTTIKGWLQAPKSKKHIAREWAYDNGFPRRIIVEELLEESGKKDIDDFKFFCYNGKFKVLEWHKDRSTLHRAGHFDEKLQYLPQNKIYDTDFGRETLPENIQEMVKVAEKLAEGFPFVRVDLYNVNGKIYFGEMTFYPASGYFMYRPESVNTWLGSFFTYPFENGSPFGK